uniref:unspecific monooxygenase n=1 Tax=Zygaena filipendulae TaxID=287375 RepID=D2JLK0_9NEOP|nr:cytochrome P450 CYP6CT1 [Zygaena filipendulae]
MTVLILLCLFMLMILSLYLWFRHKYSYWSKRGVFGPRPVVLFGNMLDVLMSRKQIFQPYCDYYFKYKHLPYVGLYSFSQPVLTINDLELARHILIKDFNYFEARGTFPGSAGDPLSDNLFNMQGNRWKGLRSKMSPTFTMGKLKSIYPLVEKIADEAMHYAESKNIDEEAINFTELYSKFSMEVTGSIGFGVEFKGFKNSNSKFFEYGRGYFKPENMYWNFVRVLALFEPHLFMKIGFQRIQPKITTFFSNLVETVVKYREENVFYKRNDYIQTLIDLMKGRVVDENGKSNKIDTDFSFSMTDVAANTMLYMIAGSDTSTITSLITAYELARNPDVQNRVREEILSVLARHDGRYTFEAQNEMKYLNMVIDETMRIHPPMRALIRRCTNDYKVPNSDLIIEEGTLVFLPVQAYQMDPDIFPDPENFDPERFTAINKANMHPCHWMPFGAGPRKCLGLRQGYIQTKLALIMILQRYELLLDERTEIPIKVKKSSLTYAPETDIWLKLRKISN